MTSKLKRFNADQGTSQLSMFVKYHSPWPWKTDTSDFITLLTDAISQV